MNVSPIIKYRTLAIAKALAPMDTGNLRHNAIGLIRVKPSSWTIRYSSRQANYLEPLEEGWVDSRTGQVHTPHKGFIEGTSKVISIYLKRFFEDKPTSKWYGNRFRKALSTSQDNPQRALRNLESQIRWKREVKDR